jgi:hypothetical protein
VEYLPELEELKLLLPGAAAAALLLLLAGISQGKSRGTAVLLAAFAFAVSHVATFVVIKGWPSRPLSSSERAVCCVIAFAFGATVIELFHSSRSVRSVIRYALCAGTVGYVLETFWTRGSGDAGHVSTVFALILVGGIMVWWVALEEVATRVKGPALPAALCLAFGALGLILAAYGAASLGQLAGGAAMTAGLSVLLVRWLPGSGVPVAATGTLAGVAAAIGLDASFFMQTPPRLGVFALLLLAPLGVMVGSVPLLSSRPAVRFLVRMTPVVIAVGVAIWLAAAGAPEPDPYR